ncbi:hypothetical protein COOONC_25350, partial [Cooperia oncophora]
SNKQIGRLVAPDKDISRSTGSSVDELFPQEHVTTHEAECSDLNTDMRYDGLGKRKEREEFPYRLRYDQDYGSEGGSMLTTERNPTKSRAEIARIHNDLILRPRVEDGDSGLDDLSYEAARPSSMRDIFRSFLNRTAGMIAEENPTQPEDDGCEDIFQEHPLNLGASPTGPSATPVLEKLFNQTVAEWNADNSLDSPLRTGVNATRVRKNIRKELLLILFHRKCSPI